MLADKVPYYILDLLQQSPSVEVQGLGRFDAIFHPAVLDIPGARISPPFIEPGFQGHDASSDEFLAAYIRYVTGDDPVTVADAIARFVQRVHDATNGDGSLAIEKFGTFSRSSSGHLRFTPDWDAFNLSFNGLEPLDLTVAQETNRHVLQDIAPSPVYPDPSLPVFHPGPEPVAPLADEVQTTEPHISTRIADEIIEPESSLDEISTRLWWMILISAIVLITILCAYLAWDIISNRHRLNDIKQVSPDTMGITRVEPAPLPAGTSSDSTSGSDTPEVKVPSPVTPADTSSPPSQDESCYIIVGAFTDPANVTRMMDRLTALGFTAEQIKGSSLTKVAIRTSCEPQSLQKVLNDARSSINPEAWIY